jgi:hypothetical protein
MTQSFTKPGTRYVIGAVGATLTVAALLILVGAAHAQDCNAIGSLLVQGRSTVETARMLDVTANDVETCRRILSQPIIVGPEGLPPVGAVGRPPIGAPGPPPIGAPGPPPIGAAGPPPSGHEVKRLP